MTMEKREYTSIIGRTSSEAMLSQMKGKRIFAWRLLWTVFRRKKRERNVERGAKRAGVARRSGERRGGRRSRRRVRRSPQQRRAKMSSEQAMLLHFAWCSARYL